MCPWKLCSVHPHISCASCLVLMQIIPNRDWVRRVSLSSATAMHVLGRSLLEVEGRSPALIVNPTVMVRADCLHACWLVPDTENLTVNENPFNCVGRQSTSGEPPLDIESAFAVEDAVENRDPVDTNLSRLCRRGGGNDNTCPCKLCGVHPHISCASCLVLMHIISNRNDRTGS